MHLLQAGLKNKLSDISKIMNSSSLKYSIAICPTEYIAKHECLPWNVSGMIRGILPELKKHTYTTIQKSSPNKIQMPKIDLRFRPISDLTRIWRTTKVRTNSPISTVFADFDVKKMTLWLIFFLTIAPKRNHSCPQILICLNG